MFVPSFPGVLFNCSEFLPTYDIQVSCFSMATGNEETEEKKDDCHDAGYRENRSPPSGRKNGISTNSKA